MGRKSAGKPLKTRQPYHTWKFSATDIQFDKSKPIDPAWKDQLVTFFTMWQMMKPGDDPAYVEHDSGPRVDALAAALVVDKAEFGNIKPSSITSLLPHLRPAILRYAGHETDQFELDLKDEQELHLAILEIQRRMIEGRDERAEKAKKAAESAAATAATMARVHGRDKAAAVRLHGPNSSIALFSHARLPPSCAPRPPHGQVQAPRGQHPPSREFLRRLSR